MGLMVLSLEDECSLLLYVCLIFAVCCSQGKMQAGVEGRNVAEGSHLPKSSVDLGSDRNDELQGQVWKPWPAGSRAWSSLLAYSLFGFKAGFCTLRHCPYHCCLSSREHQEPTTIG